MKTWDLEIKVDIRDNRSRTIFIESFATREDAIRYAESIFMIDNNDDKWREQDSSKEFFTLKNNKTRIWLVQRDYYVSHPIY